MALNCLASPRGSGAYVCQHRQPSAHATTPWYLCQHRRHVCHRPILKSKSSTAPVCDGSSSFASTACRVKQERCAAPMEPRHAQPRTRPSFVPSDLQIKHISPAVSATHDLTAIACAMEHRRVAWCPSAPPLRKIFSQSFPWPARQCCRLQILSQYRVKHCAQFTPNLGSGAEQKEQVLRSRSILRGCESAGSGAIRCGYARGCVPPFGRRGAAQARPSRPQPKPKRGEPIGGKADLPSSSD